MAHIIFEIVGYDSNEKPRIGSILAHGRVEEGQYMDVSFVAPSVIRSIRVRAIAEIQRGRDYDYEENEA